MGEPAEPTANDVTNGVAFATRILDEIRNDEFSSLEYAFKRLLAETSSANYERTDETSAWLLAATIQHQAAEIAKLRTLLARACTIAERHIVGDDARRIARIWIGGDVRDLIGKVDVDG